MTSFVSYKAAGASLSLTFSARDKHDLELSPDGRATALRLVDPPLETDDTMAWPTMAEFVFSLLTIDENAKALAPMSHYVREEAWDRWLQTAGELLGPGYMAAVGLRRRGGRR